MNENFPCLFEIINPIVFSKKYCHYLRILNVPFACPLVDFGICCILSSLFISVDFNSEVEKLLNTFVNK